MPTLILLISITSGYADDTAALQAQLNAGNVTLPANKVYNITSLNVTHGLKMNGCTFNITSTSGVAIRLSAAGAYISNGTINGTYVASRPADPNNGVSAIRIGADNCSVLYMHINNFPAYGIVIPGYSNPTINYCVLSCIGYIGIYSDAEKAGTVGGVVNYNTIDRSMLPPATVTQVAIGIRGSTNNPNFTTTGWKIVGNTVKMPNLPSDWTSECIEIRYCNNSTIEKNVFYGGSIGASVVRCSRVNVKSNTFYNSQLEGIEFADCQLSRSLANLVKSSAGVGILVDGSTGSDGITLTNDTISGTTQECIHAYTNTKNLNIVGCSLTTNTKAINLQGTTIVKITNTTFRGNGVGQLAIMLDGCPGNLTMTGGTVANFTKSVIAIWNAKSGLTTDNITMSGVTLSSTPGGIISNTQNGGLVGTNIKVQ